jgi:hypothetical protein
MAEQNEAIDNGKKDLETIDSYDAEKGWKQPAIVHGKVAEFDLSR